MGTYLVFLGFFAYKLWFYNNKKHFNDYFTKFIVIVVGTFLGTVRFPKFAPKTPFYGNHNGNIYFYFTISKIMLSGMEI